MIVENMSSESQEQVREYSKIVEKKSIKSRFSEESKTAILKAWKYSKLSVEAFCRKQQVSPSAFYQWRSKGLGSKRKVSATPLTFARAEVTAIALREPQDATSSSALLDKRIIPSHEQTKSFSKSPNVFIEAQFLSGLCLKFYSLTDVNEVVALLRGLQR